MEKTVEEKVTETRERVIAIICDECGSHIQKGEVYYTATSRNNDLGNDTQESIEVYDYCSSKCACKAAKSFFKKNTQAQSVDFDMHKTVFPHSDTFKSKAWW